MFCIPEFTDDSLFWHNHDYTSLYTALIVLIPAIIIICCPIDLVGLSDHCALDLRGEDVRGRAHVVHVDVCLVATQLRRKYNL